MAASVMMDNPWIMGTGARESKREEILSVTTLISAYPKL